MKQISTFLLIILYLFSFSTIVAQNDYELMSNLTVIENGQTLKFPFVGGLEQAQFLIADLNNNGTDDLVIFDRLDDRVLTFLNNGTPNVIDYDYAPAYEVNFPAIILWMNLIDYDCDGIVDMFSGLNNGMQAYKGSYNANNELTFQLEKSALNYSGSNLPIEVIYEDIPDLIDVNNDGDVDILTNDVNGGNWIYYFENQSLELGYGCDSLIFDLITDCWGSFHANLTFDYDYDTCFSTAPLAPTKNTSFALNPAQNRKSNQIHFQKNITAIDVDGDADKDLIIGPNNWTGIHLLMNDGTASSADMNMADLNYLSTTGQSPTLIYQTKAFYVDLNNDGKRDLVLGRSEIGPCLVGEENVAWFYDNTNTDAVPNFNFAQNDFFVDNMIDVGRDAVPTFFDYNNDGLMDLIIAHYGYFDSNVNNHYSELALYENTGTPTNPVFELMQNDFGGLRYYQLQNLHPTFGDLDGDGDADMILGEKNGNLYYFNNNAGSYTLDILG